MKRGKPGRSKLWLRLLPSHSVLIRANCDLVIHVDGAFNLETYCQGAEGLEETGRLLRALCSSRGAQFRCEDAKIADYMKNTSKCPTSVAQPDARLARAGVRSKLRELR